MNIGEDKIPKGKQQSDEEREALLVEHLPEVRLIARQLHGRLPPHVPLDDLVHFGVLGLMDALNKFDPNKQVRFVSYAKYRIRGAILDGLRQMDWGTRQLRRQSRSLQEAADSLRRKLDRHPSQPELAQELRIPLVDLQNLLADIDGLRIDSLVTCSLENQGELRDLCDQLPANSDECPFASCLRSEMGELMKQAICDLPEREQQIVSMYYFEEMTMKQIGKTFGLGEARVSQIHSAALKRVRQYMGELARPS